MSTDFVSGTISIIYKIPQQMGVPWKVTHEEILHTLRTTFLEFTVYVPSADVFIENGEQVEQLLVRLDTKDKFEESGVSTPKLLSHLELSTYALRELYKEYTKIIQIGITIFCS
jgi:hypothetical protein